MTDTIASFALRDAGADGVALALARCYHEYSLWHGQATVIAGFAEDASAAGVKKIIANRMREAFDFALAEGVIATSAPLGNDLLNQLTEHEIATAHHGGRIAAIVMMHSACERFLWRMVRFGLVSNRAKGLTWIADRKISVKALEKQTPELAIDEQLEKWWDELNRDTLVRKWDCLVGLVGFPPKLDDGRWHFDREMLGRFDEVRHNAVHHDAQEVKAFGFIEFARQLLRAQLVWLVYIGQRLRLKLPGEVVFLGSIPASPQ